MVVRQIECVEAKCKVENNGAAIVTLKRSLKAILNRNQFDILCSDGVRRMEKQTNRFPAAPRIQSAKLMTAKETPSSGDKKQVRSVVLTTPTCRTLACDSTVVFIRSFAVNQ